MSNLTPTLVQTIDTFTEKFINNVKKQTGQLPKVEADTDWPSPCEVGEVDSDGMVQWQPALIDETLEFNNIEQALDIKIHPDIEQYFCHQFSESIMAKSNQGQLELLFAWNKDDFERLQQNIIGHILMKQKLKQDITVFFAVTDEEDINLVIKNDTGEVWVEPVGCEPKTLVSPSLAEFIARLDVAC